MLTSKSTDLQWDNIKNKDKKEKIKNKVTFKLCKNKFADKTSFLRKTCG